jgi:hypothetical protein
VEKFERDVLDARRRAGALEQLVREASAALAAVADQRRAAWLAVIGDRIGTAREAFSAAVGQLEQAANDYAALQGLANFVKELPRAKRYRPALVQVGDRPLAEAIAGLRRTLDVPR